MNTISKCWINRTQVSPENGQLILYANSNGNVHLSIYGADKNLKFKQWQPSYSYFDLNNAIEETNKIAQLNTINRIIALMENNIYAGEWTKEEIWENLIEDFKELKDKL